MVSSVTDGDTAASGEAGDAFDIGFKLKHRLSDAKAQKEITQAKINTLSEHLKRMFARAPKKPKDSATQMDEKITKLEYTRTSVSLCLSDEKQLLRQIDAIKRAKSTLLDYRQHEVAIQEKKSEISSLRDHLRTVDASIFELESALAKVELARRLGCDTAELQTRIVNCPSDKIGHIIGKNGSALKQLESRTGVRIDVDKVGSEIHLQGSASALDAAVREVENITLAIEEELKLTLGTIGYLLAKKSTILNKLQESHPFVYFDVSRNSNILRLRGKPDYVAMAKVDINTLDLKTSTRDLHSRETGLVVGKGGSTITKLVNDFDVSINVSDANKKTGNSVMEITGPHRLVDSAMDAIESILHENEEMEDFIYVEPMQRNMFLSNNGTVLKGIQKEISLKLTKNGSGGGLLLVFERKEGEDKYNKSEPSKLIIKSNRANIDYVKEVIESRIKQHESTVTTVTVDPSMISAIIGKGGAKIKSLRSDGVEIEVTKETGVIKIQSEDDAAKTKVLSEIEIIVAENQITKVPIAQGMIGMMFGDIGRTMKKSITEDLGVKLNVDNADENIILRGTTEKINEAAQILSEFIISNFTKEFAVPQDDVLMLLGGRQNFLSKLGKAHDVKATLRRGRNLVAVRGKEENVNAAMTDLKNFIFGGDGIVAVKVKVPESSLGLIIGKGGAHIAKLEKDFEGVSTDVNRSSNQISLRGLEDIVNKCRAHIISILASSKINETINISSKEYDTLESKKDDLRKISDEIDVQISWNERAIKLRGVANDVKDAKTMIMEHLKGKFEVSIDLDPAQFEHVENTTKDPTHFERISKSSKASLNLDKRSCSILLSGKRSGVKKAKTQLMSFFDFLFPGQFERVKLSKPVLKAISKPVILAKISAQTGASLALDRELNCILIKCKDVTEVQQASTLLKSKASESEKLNIAIRFNLFDAWLLAKIIGKDGTTVREIEAQTECKIEVSKAESTVAIQGDSPDATSNGRKAVDKVIEQARRENVFISIPESAMSAFIGKGGENIRKLSDKNRVKIDRLKKEMSTIKIQGNETAVGDAATAVQKWLEDWESANKGIKLDLDDSMLRLIASKVNAIQKETRTKIDINRRENSLTIRGSDSASRKKVVDKLKIIINAEKQNNIETTKASFVPAVTAKPVAKKEPVGSQYPTKPVGSLQEIATKPKSQAKPKKSNGSSKKVAPHTSQASQSLFNMLIADPTENCDSSTISSTDIGPEDEMNGSTPKAKVYKSSSGFSVRV